MPDTSRQILVCARDLYLRQGMDGFAMRRVARMVGISATAIYRHYKNKDELLLAILVEGYAIFDCYLQRGLQVERPAARLAATGDAYLDFALDNPRYYRLIFMAEQPWSATELPEPVARYGRTTFQFLVARVAECRADGTLRVADAETAALTIWSHGHGLISLYLSGHFAADRESFRAYWHQTNAYLFGGLGMSVERAFEAPP